MMTARNDSIQDVADDRRGESIDLISDQIEAELVTNQPNGEHHRDQNAPDGPKNQLDQKVSFKDSHPGDRLAAILRQTFQREKEQGELHDGNGHIHS